MITCACGQCGAKYRLPAETQGRAARCKKCGEKFEIPLQKAKSLEDSVLDWLEEGSEREAEADQPRVIDARSAAAKDEPAPRGGVIRMRSDQATKA